MNNEAAILGSPAPEPLSLQAAARLWLILGGLRQAIAAWGGRDRAAVPLVVAVWARVGRLAARFAALMKRLAAGPLPPPRVRVDTRRRERAAAVKLPQGFAWLVRVLPEAAAFGCQLQAMLDDPAVAALLTSCPRAARILRPLHKMLAMIPAGAPVRVSRPKKVWWTAPPPAQAAAPPVGPVLFPPGRPPPDWWG